MASPAYDGGGAGGKLRKRFFRRSATPYDRPPSAARCAVRPPEPQRNGWLSMLVDPASRIITGGASRLFSSVFRKQQLALPPPPLPLSPPPPPIPDENPQSNEQVSEAVGLNSCVQEERPKDGDGLINKPETNGISDVEQLLKQKTFTRAEFDYLSDLIQSRTVGSDQVELAGTNKEASYTDKETRNGGTGFLGDILTPNQSLRIPEEEVASPAEIAKAYMGSRPSKLSPSSLNFQRHFFREDTTLASNISYAAQPSDVSVAPRSIARFSKAPEQPDNGYFTPRPRGRSAIYKMSRSPYFKAPTTAKAKVDMLVRDNYAGPSTSSHWAATNSKPSGSKQVSKPGSSVLERDHGTFGPIRRIRQKSNLISPLKGISTPSGNRLPIPSTLGRDAFSGFTSIQKPLQFNERKYGLDSQDVKNGDDRSLDENDPHIPAQSSEMARKILQQLDKLVSPPKVKSSELKGISMDKSPSKLTLPMLQGKALRTMEDIDSSKFVNTEGNFSVYDTLDSLPQSIPQKQEVVQNGPLKSTVSQVKVTPESAVSVHATTPASYTNSDGERASDLAISGFAAVPLQEKPAFKISGIQDSLEMDDDSNILSAPSPPSDKKDKEAKTEFKATISEETAEKPLLSTYQSMSASTTKSFGVFESNTSDALVNFSFPATPAPLSSFSFTGTSATMFSLKSSGPAGSKSSGNSSAELELSTSNALTTTQQEHSLLSGDKAFGSQVSSDLSSSAASSVFAFGAPATSSLNNGSLNPKPSTIFGSNASGSGNQVISILSTSNAAATTTPSSSSVSSISPIFSTVTTFQSTYSIVPSSVSTPLDASGFKDLVANPTKTSPFSFTSATPAGSSAISNTGINSSSISTSSSTLGTSSFSPSASIGSSALAVSTVLTSPVSGSSAPIKPFQFSFTGGASSTSAMSSMFSNTFGSHSTLPSSSLFSSTGSSTFGFSSPAQSSCSQTGNNSGTLTGSGFGTQTNSSSGMTNLSQSTGKLNSFSSTPSFGLTASPSLGFGSSLFAQSASGLFSSSSQSATPIFGTTFGAGAQSASALFGSSSQSTTPIFGATFGAGAQSASALFGSSSQSTTPTFGATFGAGSSSTDLTFGMSATSASGNSPFTFGSSSGPAFSFLSAGNTASTSTPAPPTFGMSPTASFASAFPQNNQTNMEVNMTEDQPSNSLAIPSFQFSPSPAPFGQQTPNPFQPANTAELPPGGSFSLGSAGDDKANRRFIRVKRGKTARK
ncbi:hypothetical protein J5N97_010870 [Dioscorea zingiberensis]|uniref:Nuclear pore complex protein NUP1 n=1 Tax=Dioscorea zingiberensis TaxID=325984 RepID=A0A9D5D1Y8_9LILI|nr:hypothetical protein J5N97_010870 [Dioscorea zingiberensis]